jgi:hypothetical protein
MVPSGTPGGMASQALNRSSTVLFVPHRAHDPAPSVAHAGQRTGTCMEIVTMPPSDISCRVSKSSMTSPDRRAMPRTSSVSSEPLARQSITPGAVGRLAAGGVPLSMLTRITGKRALRLRRQAHMYGACSRIRFSLARNAARCAWPNHAAGAV